ncbi:MAG: hypothetical protein Q9221_000359 [Calogaya cf. arnoldii]
MSQLGSGYEVGDILEGPPQDTLEINAALEAYQEAIERRVGNPIAMRKPRKKLPRHPKPNASGGEEAPHRGRKRKASNLDSDPKLSDPRFSGEWVRAQYKDKAEDELLQSRPGLHDEVANLVDGLIGAYSEEQTEAHPKKKLKANPRFPKHNLRSSRMMEKFAGVTTPGSLKADQNLATPPERVAHPAQTTFTTPHAQMTPPTPTPPQKSPPAQTTSAAPAGQTTTPPAGQTITPPETPQAPVNPFSSATDRVGAVGTPTRHRLAIRDRGTSAPAQTPSEKLRSAVSALQVPLRASASASGTGGIPNQTIPGIPTQTIPGTPFQTSPPTQAGPAHESRDPNTPPKTPCEKFTSTTVKLPLRSLSWQPEARGILNQTVPGISIETATGITIQTASGTSLQMATAPSATDPSDRSSQMRAQARGVIARLHQEVGVAYGRFQQELECSYGKAHNDLEKISASLLD